MYVHHSVSISKIGWKFYIKGKLESRKLNSGYTHHTSTRDRGKYSKGITDERWKQEGKQSTYYTVEPQAI